MDPVLPCARQQDLSIILVLLCLSIQKIVNPSLCFMLSLLMVWKSLMIIMFELIPGFFHK